MGAKSGKYLNALRVHKTARAGRYHDNKGHGLYLVVTPVVFRREPPPVPLPPRPRARLVLVRRRDPRGHGDLGMGHVPPRELALLHPGRRFLRAVPIVPGGVQRTACVRDGAVGGAPGFFVVAAAPDTGAGAEHRNGVRGVRGAVRFVGRWRRPWPGCAYPLRRQPQRVHHLRGGAPARDCAAAAVVMGTASCVSSGLSALSVRWPNPTRAICATPSAYGY